MYKFKPQLQKKKERRTISIFHNFCASQFNQHKIKTQSNLSMKKTNLPLYENVDGDTFLFPLSSKNIIPWLNQFQTLHFQCKQQNLQIPNFFILGLGISFFPQNGIRNAIDAERGSQASLRSRWSCSQEHRCLQTAFYNH